MKGPGGRSSPRASSTARGDHWDREAFEASATVTGGAIRFKEPSPPSHAMSDNFGKAAPVNSNEPLEQLTICESCLARAADRCDIRLKRALCDVCAAALDLVRRASAQEAA